MNPDETADPTDDPDRRDGRWPPDAATWFVLGGIAVVGVVLRVVHALAVRDTIRLHGDAETYHWLGRLIASGEGYIRPDRFRFDGARVPTAEFPPLYPTTLAVLDALGLDSPLSQRVAGALFGGVTVVVLGLLGMALAGRVVGIVAAALTAAYPQLIVLDTSLLSEGLAVCLVAATLLAVVLARRAEGRVRMRWWLAAGVLVGLAALTRSETILLLPLLLVPATRIEGDRRAWARSALVASLGVVLCVGGWTVRNAVSLGHPQPFTNNSGTLIAGSNCDAVYSGPQVGLWRLDCVLPIDVTGLDETEAAAEWRSVGLDYARDHADRLPAVVTVRVLRTFGLWDVRSQLAFESLEERSYEWLWAGWVGWVVLAPAAVAGAVLRRRHRELLWPLLVPVGIVLGTAVLSYGNQRFRAAAEPSVVVLAAVAYVALGRTVVARARRPRSVAD